MEKVGKPFYFETESHYGASAGLEFTILLPQPLSLLDHTCVPLNQLKVIIWNNKSWSQIFIWLFRSWETCQGGFPKTVCDIVHKIQFCDIWLPGKNLVTQSIAQLFWEKGSSWKGNVYDSPNRLSSVKKGDYIVMQLWRGRRVCAYDGLIQEFPGHRRLSWDNIGSSWVKATLLDE